MMHIGESHFDPPTISILIVSYNTKDLTSACLSSIHRYPPIGDYETIVVDNGSKDGSAAMIARRFPGVKLMVSNKNLGFAAGNNLALRAAKYDVLLLLNSDTEVHPGALEHLQTILSENPSLAGAGGRLLNTDGSTQHNIRYFPRLSNLFSESFFFINSSPVPSGVKLKDEPSAMKSPKPLNG
jgi:hypothetical protein